MTVGTREDPRAVRVLVVGPGPAERGGIASHVATYGTEPWPADISVRSVSLSAGSTRGAKARAAARGLAVAERTLRRGEVDVLHAHTSTGASFVRKSFALSVARRHRVPGVLHVHGSDFDRFVERGPALRRRVIKGVLQAADAVVVLSSEWAEVVRHAAPAARIVVIPNGVSIPAHATDDSGPFVTLGRIGERKGSYLLVDALASLGKHAPELVLAGDGELNEVRDRAARAGVGSLTIRGWVTPEERHELLRHARAFILPSYAEGLPMALLEAMAHGIPVVATPVGGVPQVVRDGETGLLVAAGDAAALAAALARLDGDPVLRSRLGIAGRELVSRQFNSRRTIDGLAGVYRRLASGSPG